MMHDDKHNLELLFVTANRFPYNPPSYTCIKEFVNSFPVPPPVEFALDDSLASPVWVPEPPYPKIYTDSYRKSLLSALTQTIEKI
jgi:hypothetical protein